MPFRVGHVCLGRRPQSMGSMSGIHKNLIMAEMTFRSWSWFDNILLIFGAFWRTAHSFYVHLRGGYLSTDKFLMNSVLFLVLIYNRFTLLPMECFLLLEFVCSIQSVWIGIVQDFFALVRLTEAKKKSLRAQSQVKYEQILYWNIHHSIHSSHSNLNLEHSMPIIHLMPQHISMIRESLDKILQFFPFPKSPFLMPNYKKSCVLIGSMHQHLTNA